MQFLYFLEGLRNPVFDAIMSFFTLFGDETVFIILAMILFWCIDKYEGYYMLTVGFIGTLVNNFLKVNFRIDRPWVRDPDFHPVESAIEGAGGYSFPSGHTQSSVGSFGAVARWEKNKIVRAICIALCIIVPFSRMYLGVHTPADVLTSLAIALVMIFGFYPLFRKISHKPNAMRILMAILLGWSVFQLVFMELYPFPADADAERIMSGVKNTYKMLGAIAGLWVVFELDCRFIKFETKAVWWAQIIKVALGLGLSLGIKELGYLLFGAFVPEPADRAFTYFIMVIFAGALWPLSFKFFGKLKRK